MKCLLLSLSAIFLAGIAQARTADIYIIAGQSNGWRLSALGSSPGKGAGSIHYFGISCTSRPEKPAYTFIENLHPKVSGTGLASALLDHSRQKEIVFIQYCVCGSSLNDAANWYPGDDPANGKVNNAGLYGSFTRCLADARLQVEALGIEWKVTGLFWHQGEADVKIDPEKHQRNLANLFIRFRQDLGADVSIVAGHIRDLGEGSRGINRALDEVDTADPRFAVVKLDGLEYESSTDVHIKPASCIVLGRRMAEAFQQVTGAKGHHPK